MLPSSIPASDEYSSGGCLLFLSPFLEGQRFFLVNPLLYDSFVVPPSACFAARLKVSRVPLPLTQTSYPNYFHSTAYQRGAHDSSIRSRLPGTSSVLLDISSSWASSGIREVNVGAAFQQDVRRALLERLPHFPSKYQTSLFLRHGHRSRVCLSGRCPRFGVYLSVETADATKNTDVIGHASTDNECRITPL